MIILGLGMWEGQSTDCVSLCVPLGDNFLKKIFPHGMDAVGVRPRCGTDAAPQANAENPLLKTLGQQDAVKCSPKVRHGYRTIKANTYARFARNFLFI